MSTVPATATSSSGANRSVARRKRRARVEFASPRDTVTFSPETGDFPLIGADTYLNDLLVGYCEEALAGRARPEDTLRTRVENALDVFVLFGFVVFELFLFVLRA